MTRRAPRRRVAARLAIAAILLTVVAGSAVAQSSLGIGSSEAALPPSGLFGGLLGWINSQQQGFYRALSGAMKSMRDGGSGFWLLVGVSFAYGIFHAAGPGHGKAVISSYMLANEVALRRGIMLSFVSAFAQALTAIVLMTMVYLALRGTSVSMTDATWFLEIASYVLVTAFGAWLLWKKAGSPLLLHLSGRPAYSLSSAASAMPSSVLRSEAACNHGPGLRMRGRPTASAAADPVCATCGHGHAPDPALLGGDRFEWRTAWGAVAAVGIRPCSGALIVLTFAFLNGLWAAGIASVLAMALGTAITVSALASLAVGAKGLAVALAGDGRMGNRVHMAVEIGGAVLVLLIGIVLLATALTAPGAGFPAT